MALPLYNIKKTLSSTPSDYWKDSMQALIDSQFTNAPTIKTVKHNRRDIEVRVVGKFNSETLSRNNDNYQKIIFKTNDYVVSIGDLFEFDSLKWICTDIESTAVTKSCSVTKCNNTLNYYSPTDTTLTLYSIPCIIGKSTIKQDGNKYLSLPADENILICANNASTLKITENTRFILTGDAYSVVGISKIDNPGLLTIRIKEDLITEDDNLTLEIANYYSSQHAYTIEIQNSDATLNVGDTLTLSTLCTDNSEIIISPTLTYSSSNTTTATVSNGIVTCLAVGTTTITVTYNDVSDTMNLTVQSEEVADNYSVAITGSNNIKAGNNITLNASVLNYGVVDESGSVVWEVINQDDSSNVYLSVVFQDGDSIVLRASSNSLYVGKYVVVKAEKSDDDLVYKEHVIRIIGLF